MLTRTGHDGAEGQRRMWAAMAGTRLPVVQIRVEGGPGVDVLDLGQFLLDGQAITRATLDSFEFLIDPADGAILVHAPGRAGFPVIGLLDVEFLQVAPEAASGEVRIALSGLVPVVLAAAAGGGEVHGSYLDDRITGSAGADLLHGHGGNDLIAGDAGNDTIHGGDGSDTIHGGAGDDVIFGGESGRDLRDVIHGGDGNDWIDGGYGNDELNGGNGNDTLIGGFGADTLAGNDGDDMLSGGPYGDMLFGGPGRDTLNGGWGHDRLNGGPGADAFYHLGIADHGSDWVQDYSRAEGDVLLCGIAGAQAGDFRVTFAVTPGAGQAGVAEAFVIYRPSGQILWALVDGAAQAHISLQVGAQIWDLLA